MPASPAPTDARRWPAATIQRRVEWVDTDAAGHQHNSAILRWVEACEAELFRNLGIQDYVPSAPRVQQLVNFTARLFFAQVVTTNVRIEKVGRTSLTIAFEVFGEPFHGAERVSAANGHVITAHVSDTGRATPWPQSFLDAIRPEKSSSSSTEIPSPSLPKEHH
ncbi:MAG: thioesterase family protein [Microbacteriaceae bacterium]